MHWMEILKDTRYPDIRLITKSETIPLPANVGGRWQPYLINDSKTEEFIQLIKEGKYETKGIIATISTLKQWRDDKLSFDDVPEISSIYREIYQDQHIADMKVRIDKIINEVLPILEAKLKESRTTAKPTVSSSMTEEGFANLLDGFENKSDNEKKDIIEQLSIFTFRTRIKFRDFLTENYADVVIPYLKQSTLPTFTLKEDTETGPEDVTYDKLKEVSFSSSEDFNTLNYQKMNNTWVKNFTKSTPNNLISSQIQELDSSVKLDIRSHRLWILFGGQEDKEKIEKEKWSLSGNIDVRKAKSYFETIATAGKASGPKSNLRPEKLLRKRVDSWKDKRKIILEVLSPDFKIEDKMFENFMMDFKNRVTFSDDAVRLFTIRQIWNDSLNPEKKNSKYYAVLEGEDNSGLNDRDYEKYKPEIESLLRGDKVDLIRETNQKRKSWTELSNALSHTKIKILEEILTYEDDPNEDDPKLDAILEEEKILPIYNELLSKKSDKISGRDIFESIQSRLQEKTVGGVTYFTMPESRDRNLIIDLFRVGKTDDNFKNLSDQYNIDVRDTEGQSTDADILEIKGNYDLTLGFKLDKFSDTEELLAGIAYMGLIKENPESLDDILFQSDTNLIKGTLDLKEVIANILSIAVSYSNDKRGEIVKISEQIKPTENIEELILSDDPPYVEEIKKIYAILTQIIPEIRKGVIDDVQNKIKDIITHPESYKNHSKLISILESKEIIQVVN